MSTEYGNWQRHSISKIIFLIGCDLRYFFPFFLMEDQGLRVWAQSIFYMTVADLYIVLLYLIFQLLFYSSIYKYST